MIPPTLDFTSELFDPCKALHSNNVPLPYPKAKTYNNISEYYSHTFLKKGFESHRLSKKQEKPRERNYEWYYDTLGLSENQRNLVHCTKKKKRRKRKKPASLVTIPGSPLRSKKVTVCKSDFKDYCRRKYRSLNIASAITDSKSKEFEALPSESASDSSFIPYVIRTEHPDSFIKRRTDEREPTSSGTEIPSTSFRVIRYESPRMSPLIAELPSTLSVVKSEPYDSSDDSCLDDDILILKMKSNVQRGCTFPMNQKPLELSSNVSTMSDSHQIANNKGRSYISKPSHLSVSCGDSLNTSNNQKSSSASNDSDIASSKVKDYSSASVNIQKNCSKNCVDGELKLQDHKTAKHKKKRRHDKNKDESNLLHGDQNSKSDKKLKKCKKSVLKSQENVLNSKKLSNAVEIISKSNNLISKIKTENSPVINHCTCNFPCGLSHLCTCGYYANAKEALSKFKIPRKKVNVKKC